MKVVNDVSGDHAYMSDSLSGIMSDDIELVTLDHAIPTATIDLANGSTLFALFKRFVTSTESSSPKMKSLAIVIDVKEMKQLISSDIKKVKLSLSDVDILVEEMSGVIFEMDFVPVDKSLVDLVISFKR